MLDNALVIVHDTYMLNPTVTKADVVSAIQFIKTIYECVAAAGPQGIPSGHLYAQLMGALSLESYERAVAMLVKTKLVKSEGHLLTATALPA